MSKKIEYRLKYRSTREMDIIFQKFWLYFKYNHSEIELQIFKEFLNENDIDIYNWIIGTTDTPKNYDELIKNIRTKLDFKKT
tara:strand:- start:323 stop:568 length:246 start_codon:yes stop_codon:yes gene_type:complete